MPDSSSIFLDGLSGRAQDIIEAHVIDAQHQSFQLSLFTREDASRKCRGW